ncbi:MAG: hypothetical protein FJ116_12380 [Deltaproteobacteria bacterium]|nr:hypothetical protein [Deltaproteobacteria bacterium]
MSKHLKLAALGTLSLVLAVQAQGAEEKKGLMIGGSFEGGYAHSWGDSVTKERQFFIDDLNMKFNVNVSDKIKVVVDQHWAAAPTGVTFYSGTGTQSNPTNWNSSNQVFDNMILDGNNSALSMAIQSAYVEHKCGDHMTSQFGFVRTPFGIENMWTRFDSHSYYYSTGFTNQRANGWDADLGIKSTFTNVGNLEVAVLEGRREGTAHVNMPSAAARWSTGMKASGMDITPVISAYTGRWRGGPLDLGAAAGATMKMGMFGVNAEYLYGKVNASDTEASTTKTHNVWVEPTFDLGVVNASAKIDWINTKVATNASNSDWNVSGALTHDWDKLRVRGAFTTRNLNNNAGTRQHDFRVMFGTKF